MNATYQEQLKVHLAEYKRLRLGVEADGVWAENRRSYPHILPRELYRLNVLESIRTDLLSFLDRNAGIKLHTDFHHLNSSQAFAFNLFYPYADRGERSGRSLTEAFGLPDRLARVEFEVIIDKDEQTNVDAVLTSQGSTQTFCEVKLSEVEFGKAKNDECHQRKLKATYAPGLQDIVEPSLLEESSFFKHYQILRNLWLLQHAARARVAFLLPRANTRLVDQLETVLARVTPNYQPRVRVVYVERLLRELQDDLDAPPELRWHAAAMEEKYVPPGMRVAAGAR